MTLTRRQHGREVRRITRIGVRPSRRQISAAYARYSAGQLAAPGGLDPAAALDQIASDRPAWVNVCGRSGCVITSDHVHGTRGPGRCVVTAPAEGLGELVEPSCGADTFAYRLDIMGADRANRWAAADAAGAPWRPWASPVMILAGVGQHGEPWLYLACRACGWFLGYAAQHSPAALANNAEQHEAACDALAAERASASGGAS